MSFFFAVTVQLGMKLMLYAFQKIYAFSSFPHIRLKRIPLSRYGKNFAEWDSEMKCLQHLKK